MRVRTIDLMFGGWTAASSDTSFFSRHEWFDDIELEMSVGRLVSGQYLK